MKLRLILVVLSALIFQTVAYGSTIESLASCPKADFLIGMDDNEKPVFESQVWNLLVYNDSKAPYGIAASLNNQTESTIITDVKLTKNAPNDDQIAEMLPYFFPQLDPSTIKSMDYYNIGVDANQMDGLGISLIVLLNGNGDVIGQMGTAGWGFFRCQN